MKSRSRDVLWGDRVVLWNRSKVQTNQPGATGGSAVPDSNEGDVPVV